MSSENKRTSELNSITATELTGSDLLFVSDVSQYESKQLSFTELTNYIQSNISASVTSSYGLTAKSASYLIYNGIPNGTASFAISASYNISSSHALLADTSSHALISNTASYALTASNAQTASYSLTSSIQLSYSSSYSTFANSASYLIYSGTPNGTSSNANTSSYSFSCNTSSYLLYSAGIVNGTASHAMTVSTASWTNNLYYDGATPNGTASHAKVAETVLSVTTITNDYIYREFGPYTASFSDFNTASFGWFQTTASAVNNALIIEVWGDVAIYSTSSTSFYDSSSLFLEISGSPFTIELDKTSYYLSSSGGRNIQSFYMKGKVDSYDGYTGQERYNLNLFRQGSSVEFFTGSREIQCVLKANTDDFTKE